MKQLMLCVLALAGTVLNAGAQNQAVRLTKFEGKTITRVNVSNTFDVTLSQGELTRAVVEVNTELEPYLEFKLEGSTLTVALNDHQKLHGLLTDAHLKADIVVSRLDALQVTGAARVTCSGTFQGNDAQLRLSGVSRLTGLNLDVKGAASAEASGSSSMNAMKLNASQGMSMKLSGVARVNDCSLGSSGNLLLEVFGSARADKTGITAADLTLKQSGASSSDLTLDLRSLYYTGSGSSRCTLKGNGSFADFQLSGASTCNAQGLLVQKAKALSSGSARLTLNATESADMSASGASSIRYTGNPRITTHTTAASSIRPLP